MTLAGAERAFREQIKRLLIRWPYAYHYAAHKRQSFLHWRQRRRTQRLGTRAGLEQLRTEIAQERASRAAEREFLLSQLGENQGVVQDHLTAFNTLTVERDQLQRDLDLVQAELKELRPQGTVLVAHSPVEELIGMISSRADLTSIRVERLASRVEAIIADPAQDKVGIHREIAKTLFHRSAHLYSGDGLPAYLRRYTYPPVISVALSSHCNAACFFCRESDYKGSIVDFDNIFKLESAIRNARTIDLTGWGEPFFYPRFEEVVRFITSLNDTRQLIQVTSNGSFLSERWGKMLSGKLNRLIISINAATPKTYSEQMLYKNKQFTLENTVENIKRFQSELTEEDRKRIFLHMVANTGNFHEICDLVELAANLGIPVVNVGNYICAHESHLDKTLWNVKDGYNAQIIKAKALGRKVGVTVYGREFYSGEKFIKGAENCMAPFEQFFIEMPGTTAPCCFMGNERVGNVYNDGFEAVWFSDTMNRLRAERFLPPCKVCTVFSPFDSKIAHMSAFLTTKVDEVMLGGGPALGTRGKGAAKVARVQS